MSQGGDPRGLPQHDLLRPRRLRHRGRRPRVLRRARQGAHGAGGRRARRDHQLARTATTRPNGKEARAGAEGALRLRHRRHGRHGHAAGELVGTRRLYRLPPFPESSSRASTAGQRGHVLQMVRDELSASATATPRSTAAGCGSPPRSPAGDGRGRGGRARASGPSLQDLHVAVASVDPETGALRGMFAGQDYLKSQLNWAVAGGAPGSTFKPFSLATGLTYGYSLESTFDGTSPPGDRPAPSSATRARAAASATASVSLLQATEDSVNTAYVDMVDSMPGRRRSRSSTPRSTMGIPRDAPGLDDNLSIVLGSATVSPIDMANAYGTIAARRRGQGRLRHRVGQRRRGRRRIQRTREDTTQAISEDVAADTSYALQQVASVGTGTNANVIGRPIAGKTGTATDDDGNVRSSWFVGLHPAARDRGDVQPRQRQRAARTATSTPSTAASTRPGTWAAVMSRALEGAEILELPGAGLPRADRRGARADADLHPEPTPTPRPSPSQDEPEPDDGSDAEPRATPSRRRRARRRAATPGRRRPRRATARRASPTPPATEERAGRAARDGRERRPSRRPAGERPGLLDVTGPGAVAPATDRRAHRARTRSSAHASEVVGGPSGGTAPAAPVVDAGPGGAGGGLRRVAARHGAEGAVRRGRLERRGQPLRADVLLRPRLPLRRPRVRRARRCRYTDSGGRYPDLEYPVLIGYFAYGAARGHPGRARLARTSPTGVRSPVDAVGAAPGVEEERQDFFLVTAVLLAPFAAAGGVLPRRRPPRPAVGRDGRSPPRPRWSLAGLVNWDLLAVACVAGAFWAWARGRPVLSGVLHRARHRRQALPALPARRPPRRRAAAADRCPPSAGPPPAPRWPGCCQPAGDARRPRRVEGLLELQLRPRRRPRVAVAGGRAPRARGRAGHDQPRVLGRVPRRVASASWCSACVAEHPPRDRRSSPS